MITYLLTYFLRGKFVIQRSLAMTGIRHYYAQLIPYTFYTLYNIPHSHQVEHFIELINYLSKYPCVLAVLTSVETYCRKEPTRRGGGG